MRECNSVISPTMLSVIIMYLGAMSHTSIHYIYFSYSKVNTVANGLESFNLLDKAQIIRNKKQE